jgi:hypothetical protein
MRGLSRTNWNTWQLYNFRAGGTQRNRSALICTHRVKTSCPRLIVSHRTHAGGSIADLNWASAGQDTDPCGKRLRQEIPMGDPCGKRLRQEIPMSDPCGKRWLRTHSDGGRATWEEVAGVRARMSRSTAYLQCLYKVGMGHVGRPDNAVHGAISNLPPWQQLGRGHVVLGPQKTFAKLLHSAADFEQRGRGLSGPLYPFGHIRPQGKVCLAVHHRCSAAFVWHASLRVLTPASKPPDEKHGDTARHKCQQQVQQTVPRRHIVTAFREILGAERLAGLLRHRYIRARESGYEQYCWVRATSSMQEL